jgi:hypothetical protein
MTTSTGTRLLLQSSASTSNPLSAVIVSGVVAGSSDDVLLMASQPMLIQHLKNDPAVSAKHQIAGNLQQCRLPAL